ncbi:MAG: cyclic pyranopterin monophosphate synthase MoaC [Bacillota bacterium]|nr:cyclic pyranopterin monophosphate synthase MoaC [Bacillota bacterium]
MRGLTHLDAAGHARMVDVGDKKVTARIAVARGRVLMNPATLVTLLAGGTPKGDVLAAARIAGIMAAKRTAELIPLCHQLALDAVELHFASTEPQALEIEARVRVTGRTGAEMEALTAVAVAGLTVYDMCKALDRGMVLDSVRLAAKSGGQTGEYRREGEIEWHNQM